MDARSLGLLAGLSLVGLAALSGCADLRGALRETFGSEEFPERIGVPPPSAAGYPNLASVPQERPPISSPELRAEAEARLARERAAARYYDDPLPRAPLGASAAATAAGAAEALPPPPFVGEAVAALAPPPPLPPDPPGKLIGLIYFAEGSARLAAADRLVLSDVLALQRRLGGRLIAVGHASPAAAEPLRAFRLSLARAEEVGRALASLGAEPGGLRLEARGALQPVYQETSATGVAGNNRVELYLAP